LKYKDRKDEITKEGAAAVVSNSICNAMKKVNCLHHMGGEHKLQLSV